MPDAAKSLKLPKGNLDVPERTPLPVSFTPRQAFTRQPLVILAQTGERVRRQVTISNLNSLAALTELTPLLGNALPTRWWHDLARYYHDPVVRLVLKASVAYLIALFAVYIPWFNEWLGSTDLKHVTATVAVYFHPLRLIGLMHQTLIYAIVCIIYLFSVLVLCRLLLAFFYVHGEEEISYTIDLVVCLVALGVVAFFKQKVNKATFNTACLLLIISLVGCIIKEGLTNSGEVPLDKIDALLRVIVLGCVVTVAVCYLLWPVHAVSQLRALLNDSYNIMLVCLLKIVLAFLTGEPLKETEVFNLLQKNIAELQSSLAEAKFELRALGREREWVVFEQMVKRTIELMNHTRALRTSLEIQYLLLGGEDPDLVELMDLFTLDILRLSQLVENLTSYHVSHVTEAENLAQLFSMFVYYLLPLIKLFVFTMKGVLGLVPFEQKRADQPSKFAETKHLQAALNDAISLFRTKQEELFDKLYSQDLFRQPADFIFKADQEEVAACCGNFSLLLTLFGEGLLEFIKVSETYEDCRALPKRWPWLKFWKKKPPQIPRNASLMNAAILGFKRNMRQSRRPSKELEPLTWKKWLWQKLRVFRRVDVQFGIRVGLGLLVLGFFAFWPYTKALFNKWRLEWALTIYCIMMNKLLGGTTLTVKWRFIGTFLGAIVAYIVWDASDANVYALGIAGFLLAIPLFYIIIFWKQNNPFGRFILLTYNLTALYLYLMLQHDNEDGEEGGENPIIADIAFHRFIAVLIGIVWAMTMAITFFPNLARLRLKRGLSVLWLRLGVIWDLNPLDDVNDKLVGMKGLEDIGGVLAECQTLAKQAPNEFRLKGTFPKLEYTKLLSHTQKIVDAFRNMELMIQVQPELNNAERGVLYDVAGERAEVEHRIFLIFYTLALAIKLGFPLPLKPALPDHAKDRMLYRLSEIRGEGTGIRNEDYILLYLYILVTTVIVEELDQLMVILRQVMGDISIDVFEWV